MEFTFALRAPVFDQRPQANIEIAAILPLSRRCQVCKAKRPARALPRGRP